MIARSTTPPSAAVRMRDLSNAEWTQDALLPALQERDLITEEQVSLAMRHQAGDPSPKSLVHYLIQTESVEADTLLTLATETFAGIEAIDLSSRAPHADALSALSSEVAHRLRVLPLWRSANTLHIAAAHPYPLDARTEIQMLTGLDTQPFFADEFRLYQALNTAYPQTDSLDAMLASAAEELQPQDARQKNTRNVIEKVAGDGKVPRTLDQVLQDGVRRGASDIHIEFYETYGRVRYRIDGHMVERKEKVDVALQQRLINRVKVLADMNTGQSLVPDNGGAVIEVDGRTVSLRISTLPTVGGEKVVARIMEQATRRMSLDELGMQPQDLEALRDAAQRQDRMVLVTGPTGSGKTTTHYALLSELNHPSLNIVTIEDPVERRIEGINQVNIRGRASEDQQHKLTFAGVMMNVLRQDPDIIMVGEIRDRATAEVAFDAAVTGHRVLSTLHTTDTAQTVNRMVNLGIEPFAVAEATELIIAQRLVRRICNNCREETAAPEPVKLSLGGVSLDWARGVTFFRGRGCPECSNTGFRGRIGIYEMMRMTSHLRRIICENVDADQLRSSARDYGLITLREAGLDLVKAGITTIQEVLAGTPRVD